MGESPGNPADAIHPGSVRICTPDAADGWPRDSHAEPGITPISADERRQTCRRRLRHTRRHPARRAFGTTTPEGLRQFTAGAYVHHVFGDPYREEVVVNTTTKWTVAAGLALALALGGGATAEADPASPHPGDVGRHHTGDTALASDFRALDRNTQWQLTGKLKLNFPTFHTEGIAFAGNRVFLSAVQVIEPTVKYPTPQGGYDRTPGKGIGHLFVMDRQGNLDKDIVLGEGDMYHPGGIDFDKTTGHLVGNTWGSRRFAEWTLTGKQLDTWDNRSFFIDYQDCQYVPNRKMICGGVTNLPQTPTAGGTGATYELGGMALIDLRSHDVLREVPFQQWSTAGHVATRNPLKLAAAGDQLTMWAAPDNGDEGNGTEILTYQATVSPTTN